MLMRMNVYYIHSTVCVQVLLKRVVSIAYEFELLVHPVLRLSLTVESFHKWKHETLSGLGLAGLQPVTG